VILIVTVFNAITIVLQKMVHREQASLIETTT